MSVSNISDGSSIPTVSWSKNESLELPEGMYCNTVAAIGDGRIVIGGIWSNNVFIQNGYGNDKRWQPFPNINTPTNTYGHYFQLVAFGNKVYAVGCHHQNDASEVSTLRVANVDDQKNDKSKWKNLKSTSNPRAGFRVVKSEAYLYLLGGNCDYVERYDILGDKWEVLPPMPTPRLFHTAVKCGNAIYVIGGYNNSRKELSSVDVFDITTKKWRIEDKPPPMPHPRWRHATVVDSDRYIIVIGGIDGNFKKLSSTLIFDTVNNRWFNGDIDMSTKRHNCSVVLTNSKTPYLVVLGGKEKNNDPLQSVEEICLYSLQPNLLPYWRPGLHQFFGPKVANSVLLLLLMIQRGDVPILKEILVDYILPYSCCAHDE